MSPTHDFKNIGEVLDFEILKGTITAIDSVTDTCTVTVAESSYTALIYYHCKPDSIARENGAIEGSAAGFNVDDEVMVLINSAKNIIKVIGHIDGVKKCGKYIYIKLFYYFKKTARLVWDVIGKKVATFGEVTFPCELTTEIEDWLDTFQEDDEEALFTEIKLYLRDGTFRYNYPSPSDWTHESEYPGVTEDDFGHNAAGGELWSMTVHAYGSSSGGGDTPFCYPSSWTFTRDTEIFKYRIFKESSGETIANTAMLYEHFDFISPHDETVMGTITSEFSDNWDNQHCQKLGGLTPDYFSGPFWNTGGDYGIVIGRKSKSVVYNFFIITFVRTDFSYVWEYWNLPHYQDLVISPLGNREHCISAQALHFPGGYDDSDILPLGRTTEFEDAIKDTIETFYDINGYGKSEMAEIYWEYGLFK